MPLHVGLQAIDWAGSVSICAATLLLLIGLQLGGQSYAWASPLVVGLIVSGMLSYISFFLAQWKISPRPVMPLNMFDDISNVCALAVCACDGLVFNSVAYFLPLYFQAVLQAAPALSGVWMLALAVPLAVASLTAGFVMERSGRYLELLRGGLMLMVLGLGLFIDFPAYRSYVRLVLFLAVLGLGFGPNFHAPLLALQTRIRPADLAAGTATFGFVRMVSGAVGVVLGQVVFQGCMRASLGRFQDAGVPTDLGQVVDSRRGRHRRSESHRLGAASARSGTTGIDKRPGTDVDILYRGGGRRAHSEPWDQTRKANRT